MVIRWITYSSVCSVFRACGYFNTPSIDVLYSVGCNDIWMVNWKDLEGSSLPNVKCILKFFLNGLRKTTRTSANLMFPPTFESSTSLKRYRYANLLGIWNCNIPKIYSTIFSLLLLQSIFTLEPYISIWASDTWYFRCKRFRSRGSGLRSAGRPARDKLATKNLI